LLKFSAAFDHSDIGLLEQPLIAVFQGGLPSPAEAEEAFSCKVFDHIVAREPWRRSGSAAFESFALCAAKLLSPRGTVSILQSPPRLGERISRLLAEESPSSPPVISLSEKLTHAEDEFFGGKGEESRQWAWDAGTLETSFAKAGFTVGITLMDNTEERLITKRDISIWFDWEKSAWGAFIAARLGEKDFSEIRALLESRINEGPIKWKWKSLLLKASLAAGY